MNIEIYIDNAIREGKFIIIKYIKYNGEISNRTVSDLRYTDEFGNDYIGTVVNYQNKHSELIPNVL